MQLSKRTAQLDPRFIGRIEKTVKQLQFNDLLHDDHKDKLKDSTDHEKASNKAQRYMSQLSEDLQVIDKEARNLRSKLKENDEEKKEIKYYLTRLRESWALYTGNHPVQDDLRQIERENETYER